MTTLPITNRAWWWFPWAIVGCFVVIIIVNGALAYFAIHSSTGLVTEHPFELGNGYNEVLAEGAAQDALGWRGTVRFIPGGTEHGRIEIALRDAGGQKLADLTVKAELVRPVEDLAAIPVTLTATEPGLYVAPVALNRVGQWQVRVLAKRGKDTYVFVERIFVR